MPSRSKDKSPHHFFVGTFGDRSKSREGKVSLSGIVGISVKSPTNSAGLNRYATVNNTD